MIIVELYSKDECHLCDEAMVVLETVREEIPFTLHVYKLTEGEDRFEEFKNDFPIIHINRVFAFKHRISEHLLKIKLQQVSTESAQSGLHHDDDPEIEILDT